MKKIYTLLALVILSASASAQVVISQVYGGGGNTGATYKNDFVELFNRGTVAVNLNGYTIQYASATGVFGGSGTNPNKTILPDFLLQPGKYYLIQQAAGSGGTVDLVADYVPTGNQVLAMGGTNLKIALTSTDATISSATDATVLDFVGVGSANLFEGNGAVAVMSNTTSASRNNGGCTDTNNNVTDFTVGDVAPRNSSTAANVCNLSVAQNQIEGLKIYPNPVTNGTFYINTSSDSKKDVVVYDVLGKQVIKTSTTNAVNVSNLKGGVYIVKITEEGNTATRKLVIK